MTYRTYKVVGVPALAWLLWRYEHATLPIVFFRSLRLCVFCAAVDGGGSLSAPISGTGRPWLLPAFLVRAAPILMTYVLLDH